MTGSGVRRRRLLQLATLPCGALQITSAVTVKRLIMSRMLIRKAPDLRFSDITPKSLYLRRREFLQTAAGAAIGAAAAVASPLAVRLGAQEKTGTGHGAKLANVKKSPLSTTGEKITSFDDITSYNNFY